ncbi:MAG TPA: hypothetical protein VK849_04760 [Longimicrobiales bacterium]|nr:hypothetical protein [Longimicrobiales bacterium]
MIDQPRDAPPDPDEGEPVESLVASLRAGARESLEAVILYGSRLHGARPDRYSALDLVVIVRDYATFYEHLRAAGELHHSPRLMTALSRVLPPSVVAFTPGDGEGPLAKCLVVDRRHLERGLGADPPDHFLMSRLVQRVEIVWARDADTRTWLERLLREARGNVLSWVAPWLDEPFDAEALGRRMLEVCYRAELRPEAGNRAEVIFELQREHLGRGLAPGLAEAERAGRVRATGDGYRLVEPPTAADRRRLRRYFQRSKARVTARWMKHVVTFANWLPYVTRKVERRTGMKVELTRLEKRWPLIFLWPRVVRVFLSRPEREGGRR